MDVVLNQSREVAQFVARRIPGITCVDDFGKFSAVGYARSGNIVAGILLTSYNGFDVTVTVAGIPKRWASKEVLAHMFDVIFNKMGCVRASAIVSKYNVRAARFVEKLGFELEGIKVLGYDGCHDALLYGMIKTKCKWIGYGH